MAFVAPMAGEVAAGAAASSAGAAAGEAAAAGRAGQAATAAKSAPKAAPKAAGAGKAAAATKTGAPARASELIAQGKTRDDAARILRDEYGSTLAEARGLLDDAGPADDAGTGDDGDTAARRTGSATPSLPRPPRIVTRAADSGGGVVLGLLGYVLVTTYLRGGPTAVKAWLRAKFLNRVDGAA